MESCVCSMSATSENVQLNVVFVLWMHKHFTMGLHTSLYSHSLEYATAGSMQCASSSHDLLYHHTSFRQPQNYASVVTPRLTHYIYRTSAHTWQHNCLSSPELKGAHSPGSAFSWYCVVSHVNACLWLFLIHTQMGTEPSHVVWHSNTLGGSCCSLWRQTRWKELCYCQCRYVHQACHCALPVKQVLVSVVLEPASNAEPFSKSCIQISVYRTEN